MTKSEIDFSAWDAPPPPEGLADAVVARMAEPEPLPAPAAPRRRWVIAASAAAALAIAGGLWAITRPRGAAAPDHGEVVADKAQHLELGGVSADLDRGADVRWQRTRTALEVEQRAGAASWRVVDDQHVRIGAAVASIDATGASLRVEVPMNPSDARVIGASAVTAAAVAMTVVVYEGHVKVASSGQTVVVQPGTTYTVRLPEPAPAPVVAATVAGHPKVAVLELETKGGADAAIAKELTEDLRARLKTGIFPYVLAAGSDKVFVDEKILHGCEDETPACLTAIAQDLGADILVYGQLDMHGGGYEVVARRFDVGGAAVAVQSNTVLSKTQTTSVLLQGSATVISNLLFGSPAGKSTCDPGTFIAKGNEQMAAGKHLDALASYESAIACKPEIRSERLAFMAACNASNVTKAREHWRQLDMQSQQQVLQICVRNGITKDQLDPCDVEALTNKGMEAEQVGQHAAALASWEAAIACQPSPRVYQLAFMAACNAKSVSKARQYWSKIPPATAQQLKQMCIRNGISEETLDGGPVAPAPAAGYARMHIDSVPPATILLDGHEIGRTTPLEVTTRPGKHKVTFVVGGNRYTYPVDLKAGETQTLSKDLQ